MQPVLLLTVLAEALPPERVLYGVSGLLPVFGEEPDATVGCSYGGNTAVSFFCSRFPLDALSWLLAALPLF